MTTRVKEILNEIGLLSDQEKEQVWDVLKRQLEEPSTSWKDLRGVAKGVWDQDGQDFVNQLRNDS